MTKKFTPLRKFFSDSDGTIAIGQTPNAPLVIWLLFAVLSHLVAPGHWQTLAQSISKGAILIWAIFEIYSGVSPFRRVLGCIVLILSIASLL